MMRLVAFLYLYLCYIICFAQVITNPVFDRTDISTFHVNQINITKDTTFVYCIYSAEEGDWVNISNNTFIENIGNGCRYTIIKVSGIPFGPDKRHFTKSEDVQIVLYFPAISADKINIIEDEDERAFNVYGIDLHNSYAASYNTGDINYYFNSGQKLENEKDWASAIEYYKKQLEATNYIEGINSFASACVMYNLMAPYIQIKEYEQCVEQGKKVIGITRVLPKDSVYSDVLARAYGNVSTAYYLLGQHEESKNYRELSLAVRRIGEGIGVVSYERYLQDLARDYYYEENYPKAYLYGKEVVDIYREKYNENKNYYGCVYANSLSNLSVYSSNMDKNEDAIDYANQAVSLMQNSACEDSWLSDAIYYNLAIALKANGQTDKAIGYLEQIISKASLDNLGDGRVCINSRYLLASIYLEENNDIVKAENEYKALLDIVSDSISKGKKLYFSEYGKILHKLYKISEWREPNTAIQYLNEFIQVKKEREGENSVAYANACIHYLNNIFVFTNYLGKDEGKEVFLRYLKQSSEIIKRHINNAIYNMSKRDRQLYWQRYAYLYNRLIPTVCGLKEGADDTGGMAYDATLFYKGMLLSAENEFKDAIRSSHNDSLSNLFKEYRNTLSELESLYGGHVPQLKEDSLKREIQKQEFVLSQTITRFNRNYRGTSFSWEDIRSRLKNEDIAIEICSYYGINGKDIYYDAYIIDCNSSTPVCVPLFNEDMLSSYINKDSIDYDGLSRLIWGNKSLANYLEGKKNIYISPSGLLNFIGFEYLPIENGQNVCDKFNIYRLSSTRELCFDNKLIRKGTVCLYGGLDYNCSIRDDVSTDTLPQNLSRAVVDSVVSRGGFDPLFGSKQEIEQIEKELERGDYECYVYTDSYGTEESFKRLSGKQINIIHLSTHGMYVSPEDYRIGGTHNFRFLISDDTPNIDEETISLSHSFLAMSGGNILVRKDSIPNGKDDEILTALEISHLDFSNLDMVVLSACQTGLGSVHSEGVYGLQRAFKKGGANTIVMSLDKVDDEATRILMVEFYKNLMEGKSKHQSLKDAQMYLRKVENGKYDNPKYWASFIMLDGLN